jgi:hypothetical protein
MDIAPAMFSARRFAIALVAAAAAGALAVSPATASGGGGGSSSSGPCSTVSGWTLQGQAAGGTITVRADVFSRELDSVWKWKLFDNGKRFAKGTAVMDKERHDLTYFEVRRSTGDQQGSDEIRFVATQTVTKEVCDGSLTV